MSTTQPKPRKFRVGQAIWLTEDASNANPVTALRGRQAVCVGRSKTSPQILLIVFAHGDRTEAWHEQNFQSSKPRQSRIAKKRKGAK